jgi:hypothetical protein
MTSEVKFCGKSVIGVVANSGLRHRPVMFMANNDVAARESAAALLGDLGFDPLVSQALIQGKGRTGPLPPSVERSRSAHVGAAGSPMQSSARCRAARSRIYVCS